MSFQVKKKLNNLSCKRLEDSSSSDAAIVKTLIRKLLAKVVATDCDLYNKINRFNDSIISNI